MRRTTPHLLLLALCASSAFTTAIAADQDVIARMGDITITQTEARELAKSLPAEARGAQELEKLIRTEIIRRGVAAQARKQSFDKKPEVAARMDQAAEQALVTSYMNVIAQPPAGFPSEELLKKAYEANKSALMAPPRVKLSQIFIPGMDDKARKLSEEVAKQAQRKGADFAALARKYSKHAPSADKGGELGWASETELAPAFRQALQGAAKGAVSDPVAGTQGWHLLKLEDRKEAELQSFDKVRDALARSLRLRKAAEIERAYLDGMLERTPISLNGLALDGLLK